MGSPSNDCYLCGAQNDAHASFCVRCNGQLLSLGDPDPADDVDPAVDAVAETEVVDPAPVPQPADDAMGRLRQLRRKSTLDDERLSAALGIVDDEDHDDFPSTNVTAVPKARNSLDIPLLGTTSAGVIARPSMSDSPNARVLVLLGLLFLATAWLGYTAIGGPQPAPASPPDNLALTDTTLPQTTTTTTEAPIRLVNQSEAQSRTSNAFRYVQLLDCDRLGEDGAPVSVLAPGMNIDDVTTIVDISPLPSADLAMVTTLSGGNSKPALLVSRPTGAKVAVSLGSSPSLELVDDPVGAERFFVHLDIDAGQAAERVFTEEEPNGALPYVAVTDQGDVLAVQIAGQTFTNEQLAASTSTIEIDPEAAVPGSPCGWLTVLSPVAQSPAGDPESPEEDPIEDEEPEQ